MTDTVKKRVGRRPLPVEDRKVAIEVTLHPNTIAYLRTLTDSGKVSEAIEQATEHHRKRRQLSKANQPALNLLREFVEHYAGNKASQLGTGYAQQWYQRATLLTSDVPPAKR